MSLTPELAAITTRRQELQAQEYLLIEKGLHSNDPGAVVAAQRHLAQIQNKERSEQKSFVIDPMAAVQNHAGFFDRPTAIDYQVLRAMARTPIIKAIIETRIEQVAAFCAPPETKYSPGFVIRKKKPLGSDQEPKLTKQDQAEIARITEFFLHCGADANRWTGQDFDKMNRLGVRESLTFDQDPIEIVRARGGQLAEFLTGDGATFRIADHADLYANQGPMARGRWSTAQSPRQNGYLPQFVQVYDDQIVNEYYPWELSLGIRNPQADIRSGGYGISELEDLVTTVTSMLNADLYNSNFFKIGSAPKGFLTIKGSTSLNEAKLQEFRSQWLRMMAGAANSHRTPVFNEDVSWTDLDKTNRDMEYSHFNEYLIKIACAIFKMDPSEIGFPMQGASDAKPMFEGSNEAKLKFSRDKGLAPLLRSRSARYNKFIASQLNKEFEFAWVGLDQDSETDEDERDIKKMGAFMTINEIRQKRGLKPIENGDIIANAIYYQAYQAAQQAQQGDPEATGAVEADQGEQAPNPFDSDSAKKPGKDDENPFEKGLQDYLNQVLTK